MSLLALLEFRGRSLMLATGGASALAALVAWAVRPVTGAANSVPGGARSLRAGKSPAPAVDKLAEGMLAD